jgi:predicted DNA-binding transcriptional regulator AlpA
MDDPDEQLPPEIVAQLLHVSPDTLVGWRTRKVGPPYVRLNPRMVRYPRGELIDWLRSSKAKGPPPSPKVHEARRQQAKRAREAAR